MGEAVRYPFIHLEKKGNLMESRHPFTGKQRLHISFPTRDLAGAVRFYELLFGTSPLKSQPDYVKFSSDSPSVNFSLTRATSELPRAPGHFGIELQSDRAVREAHDRLALAGVEAGEIESVVCCYSQQTKFWVHDPDGNAWEFFSVGSDASVFGSCSLPGSDGDSCSPGCCSKDASAL